MVEIRLPMVQRAIHEVIAEQSFGRV
jgi:hypothetical protein